MQTPTNACQRPHSVSSSAVAECLSEIRASCDMVHQWLEKIGKVDHCKHFSKYIICEGYRGQLVMVQLLFCHTLIL
jgi:hypothetical protein